VNWAFSRFRPGNGSRLFRDEIFAWFIFGCHPR
jgi:hypothetical protein